MQRNFITIILSVFVFTTIFGQKNKTVMKNEMDTISYSIGLAFGSSLKKAGFDQINDKLFMQAISEALSGKEPLFNEEQINKNLQAYMMKMHEKKVKANLEKGQKFLEENKKKEGVVTLPSGLQYKVIKDGTGESPSLTDKVTCHYHGTTIDGKVFDSSVQRGEPVQFPVNGVIAGWTEALQLMKPGSKWTLYIPANLAYGDQQMQGSQIEPNSVLIFDVELISIDKGEAPKSEEPVSPLENNPQVDPTLQQQ